MQLTLKADSRKNLAEQLAAAGYPLDLRCGGNGTCGRCRVCLRSGEWETDGKPVSVPAEVNACRRSGRAKWPPHGAAARCRRAGRA